MNVEMLRQIGQRLLALKGGQCHLRLEARCVVPARSSAHHLSCPTPHRGGGPSRTAVSGYDLRLLADLAAADPERATLPGDRVALYRMLARANGPDGQPLRLEGLEQLAWTMMIQRRRRIVADDEKLLG